MNMVVSMGYRKREISCKRHSKSVKAVDHCEKYFNSKIPYSTLRETQREKPNDHNSRGGSRKTYTG